MSGRSRAVNRSWPWVAVLGCVMCDRYIRLEGSGAGRRYDRVSDRAVLALSRGIGMSGVLLSRRKDFRAVTGAGIL